jgi:hypothetical protein
MAQSERSARHTRHRQTAAVLVALAWAFWLPYWGPLVLVLALVGWVILHKRLEANLGEALRRAWPPSRLVLIVLLLSSAPAFVLGQAPITARIVPIGLEVLALSVILFGHWWSLFTLPPWLGGPSRSHVRVQAAIGTDALTLKEERR